MDATLEHNNEDHDEDEEEQGDDDDQPNEHKHKHSRTIQRIYRQEVVDMHSQSKASIATELITFEHCTCTGLHTGSVQHDGWRALANLSCFTLDIS